MTSRTSRYTQPLQRCFWWHQQQQQHPLIYKGCCVAPGALAGKRTEPGVTAAFDPDQANRAEPQVDPGWYAEFERELNSAINRPEIDVPF
jgi:hypothetical protein